MDVNMTVFDAVWHFVVWIKSECCLSLCVLKFDTLVTTAMSTFVSTLMQQGRVNVEAETKLNYKLFLLWNEVGFKL